MFKFVFLKLSVCIVHLIAKCSYLCFNCDFDVKPSALSAGNQYLPIGQDEYVGCFAVA